MLPKTRLLRTDEDPPNQLPRRVSNLLPLTFTRTPKSPRPSPRNQPNALRQVSAFFPLTFLSPQNGDNPGFSPPLRKLRHCPIFAPREFADAPHSRTSATPEHCSGQTAKWGQSPISPLLRNLGTVLFLPHAISFRKSARWASSEPLAV